MPGVLVYGIEITVGAACLVAAWGARRRDLVPAALALAIAGVAAVLHGAGALVG